MKALKQFYVALRYKQKHSELWQLYKNIYSGQEIYYVNLKWGILTTSIWNKPLVG